MNLARVVGKVWATRKVETLDGLGLLVIQPVNGDGSTAGDRVAAVDLPGCLAGQTVFYVTSKEAALPLKHKLSPVDACIVGIVDHVDR